MGCLYKYSFNIIPFAGFMIWIIQQLSVFILSVKHSFFV
jgi:hypothetical protein